MHTHTQSDRELLALLLGRRGAAARHEGSLRSLFEHALRGDPAYARLAAARELVRRALVEEMEHRPVLANPAAVRDYLRLSLSAREQEVFVALFLTGQHHLIAAEELSEGTLTQTSVYPREVLKRALARNAAAVIFAHNHPSGVAEPSTADEALTRNLKAALALVDVRVLDHFIVAGNSCVSFAERGLL
jgi:DNA repair protein RadC